MALALHSGLLDGNFDARSLHVGGRRYIDLEPRLATPCHVLTASAGAGMLEWRVDGAWVGVHSIELQLREPGVAKRARLRLYDALGRALVDVDAVFINL